MTGLQIAAGVVVCADIGIIFAALLWPEPHEHDHADQRAALPVTALSAVPAEAVRPRRGRGRIRLVRTLLDNSRRHSP